MKKLLLIILLSSVRLAVFSQADSLQASLTVSDTFHIAPTLFENDDLLEIALKFDIRTYRRKKPEEEELKAVLVYYTSGSDSVVKNVKLSTRGNLRRTICDYPPIRLNFKMSDSTTSFFDNIDKLKLVTHCNVGNEKYVLKEYLIYKMFNVLTDTSFKVKLLRIKYIDTPSDRKQMKPIVQFGFAIEPIELLTKRTNTMELEVDKFSQKLIYPKIMNRFAIFNYMIGNCDWEFPTMHNLKILKPNIFTIENLAIVVPYDFDYSGLVDASYAVPPQALPIKSVRERYYYGICRSIEEYKDAIQEFLVKKDEFYRIINEFPYLNPKEKKDMKIYLDGFYSGFDKHNSIINKFISECKDFQP